MYFLAQQVREKIYLMVQNCLFWEKELIAFITRPTILVARWYFLCQFVTDAFS